MAVNAKAALNIWCGKKKLKVDYVCNEEAQNSSKDANSHNFKCEIIIQSISQVFVDFGPNKKIASTNAALTALNFLIQQKYLRESEFSQPCYQMLNIKQVLFPNSNGSDLRKENESKVNQYNPTQQICQKPAQTSNQNRNCTQKNEKPKQSSRFFSDSFNNRSFRENYHGSPNYCNMPPPSPRTRGPRFANSGLLPAPRFSGPDFEPRPDLFRFGPRPFEPRFCSWGPEYNFDNFQGYFGSWGPEPGSRCSGPGSNRQGPGRFNDYNYMSDWRMNQRSFGKFRTKLKKQNAREEANSISIMQNLNLNFNENEEMFSYEANKNTNNQNDDDEESISAFIKETKKRKFENSDTVINKLEQIRNDCNFTMDNSKQQLNIFFQINRIQCEYNYSSYGPPHSKTFVSSMKFFVPRNKKEYEALEKGNSKQDASRLCALNILYQLHKDKLIDNFEPEALSKRQMMKMQLIYLVDVKSELRDKLLTSYHIVQSYNQYALQLKFLEEQKLKNQLEKRFESNSSFLYWCPPLDNFNPWTNSNLDGTLYQGKSKEDVDVQLQEEFQTMIKSQKFQNILLNRMKLPIWQYKEKVISLIENNSVIIIKGSTGCGKTTQVPQFILDSYIRTGNGSNCNIIVTQPRRISAMSIAERVAYERTEELKDGKFASGYAVRFDHVHPRPYGSILFCTTGHLLRKIQGGLKGISHLIIDEVHERDINTDLLLTIVHDLINLNLNIRVVIMSATLGVAHFQKYFNCSEILEIDSQLFPVDRYYLEDAIEMIRWRPRQLSYLEDDIEIDQTENSGDCSSFEFPKSISQSTIKILRELKEGVICFELIVSLLEYIHSLTITGSILIFLPGWNSIFALFNYLKKHSVFGNESKFTLLPLHSQLSHRDNNRIFHHTIQRKIILSTNIAETSITIDDVVFVIDTCLIKRKVYDPRTNVTSYLIDWVSKSNIQQRQGRAGRVRTGYFFVLCTRKRFELLEEFKRPEILVSSLVETSLLIKYLGFGSVSAFLKRTLDPPSTKSVEEALKTLRDINAFDANNELTSLGSILAKMPLEPRIGRTIIESIMFNLAAPVTTIAAFSSINYEFFDNSDLPLLMETLLSLDEERFSDHLIFLKVFSMYGSNDSTVYKTYRCVNLNALQVVENARKQLVSILIKCGFSEDLFQNRSFYSTEELDIISGLLVSAFYPNVCIHKDTRRVLTNEERIGLIHKTSVFYSHVHNQTLSKTTKLKSPVFIYSEKSQSNNLISSKQLTMVSFLQLLLFGVRTFEFPPNAVGSSSDTILIDSWIEIKIDPQVFDCLWQMKTEFEGIVSRVCAEPKSVKTLTQIDCTVVDTIRSICLFDNVSVNIIGK